MVNDEVNITEAVFDYKTALQDGTADRRDRDVLEVLIRTYLELREEDVVQICDETIEIVAKTQRITKQDIDEFYAEWYGIRYINSGTWITVSLEEEV